MAIELLSLKLKRQQRLEKKSRSELHSKKIENKILLELQDKLEEHLSLNDRVMIEVRPNVLGEFINILDDRLEMMYGFEQLEGSGNKFIFYNKEIEF